ncbi:MAG: hypothetical protein R3F11_33240 [Verrucomicrobiales bacterium]
MQSKTFSIAAVSLFVAGVAAWYAARYWAFDQFRPFTLIGVVLAIALAVSFLRGDVFSRWLTLAFSLCGAYSSFNLLFHIRSKAELLGSREIAGEAFILPGVIFSLSTVLLVVAYLVGHDHKRTAAE